MTKKEDQVTLKRKLDDPESKMFWEFIDRRADAMDKWPEWKRGDSRPPTPPAAPKSDEPK